MTKKRKMTAFMGLAACATMAAAAYLLTPSANAISKPSVPASKKPVAVQTDMFDISNLGSASLDTLDPGYADASGSISTDDPNPPVNAPPMNLDVRLGIDGIVVWSNIPYKQTYGLPISNSATSPTQYNYHIALAPFEAGWTSGSTHTITWNGQAEGVHQPEVNNYAVEGCIWSDSETVTAP